MRYGITFAIVTVSQVVFFLAYRSFGPTSYWDQAASVRLSTVRHTYSHPSYVRVCILNLFSDFCSILAWIVWSIWTYLQTTCLFWALIVLGRFMGLWNFAPHVDLQKNCLVTFYLIRRMNYHNMSILTKRRLAWIIVFGRALVSRELWPKIDYSSPDLICCMLGTCNASLCPIGWI